MTDVGIGSKGFLGFGQESVYGTAVARSNFVEIDEEGIERSEGRINSSALASVGFRSTKLAQGGIGIAGDFSFAAPYAGWERLLKNVMGAVSSSRPDVTSNPTVWDHAMTIADELPTGLTVEVYRDNVNFTTEPSKSFLYTGCLLSSCTLSCTTDDLLKASFSMIGQTESRVAKSTPSYDTSRLAVYHQGTVKWNDNDVEAGEFSVTMNNALETRPKLGSRLTRAPKRSGKLEVMGTFRAEFVGWSEYDDFCNATERAFQAQFLGNVISGAYRNQITIDIPIGVISSYRVVNDTFGRLIMDISFQAYRSDSANEITITMRNTTTSSLAN